MLRITNLLRGRLPKHIPMRAGIPNWDRPDPPPTVRYNLDHQLSDTQIIFDFRDGGEPQFFITQPQVYEGDTVIQALPSFLTKWAFFLAIAGGIGFVVYYTNPLRRYKFVGQMKLSEIRKQKQAVSSRKWIKLATQHNPIGLKPTSDTYKFGGAQMKSMNKLAQQANQSYVNPRNQIRKYLINVKEKAQKKVKENLAKLHSHQHTSHDGHQSHQVHTQHQQHQAQSHAEQPSDQKSH